MYTQDKKELKEAIDVADKLIEQLEDVLNDLKSAKNWAMADFIFGDSMVGFFKRSKMEKAQSKLERIKDTSLSLKKELSDVNVDLEEFQDLYGTKDFLLDIVFDNPFTDWRIKKEIGKVYDSTEDYLDVIVNLREKLQSEYDRA